MKLYTYKLNPSVLMDFFLHFKNFIVIENTNGFDHKFSNLGSAIPVSNLLHSFMMAYELIIKHSILNSKLKIIMI